MDIIDTCSEKLVELLWNNNYCKFILIISSMRKGGMRKEPRELYYSGKISAEEYIRRLFKNNEYDKSRKKIIKNFKWKRHSKERLSVRLERCNKIFAKLFGVMDIFDIIYMNMEGETQRNTANTN